MLLIPEFSACERRLLEKDIISTRPLVGGSESELTRNFWHPIVPPAAEEFPFRWQICRFVECSIENIDEVTRICLQVNKISLVQGCVRTLTPCERCQGKPPTPYSSKPLPHSEQNSLCKIVPEPLSASWTLTNSCPCLTDQADFGIFVVIPNGPPVNFCNTLSESSHAANDHVRG